VRSSGDGARRRREVVGLTPAPPLYTVTRGRRIVEVILSRWLAILGVLFPTYFLLKAIPLVPEAVAFLRLGFQAWISAVPIGLVLLPFLLWYGITCLRVVLSSIADAFSTSSRSLEGSVTHVSSTPFAFMSGRTFLSGVVTHLRVDEKLFVGVPTWVVAELRVGERVRVVYTPRLEHVLSIERSGFAPAQGRG
jgi:hypothetical protein